MNRREVRDARCRCWPLVLARYRAAMRCRDADRSCRRYIKTLGIPMFKNNTPYQSVEQLFTQKVRLEFQSSRRYTIVPSDEGVDGIVRGEIQSISLQPVNLNDSQLASRFRVTVAMKLSFEDVKAGKTLWENPALSFSDQVRARQQHQRRGRVRVRRQRAHRHGSHVDRLRALDRRRDLRGLLTGRQASGLTGQQDVTMFTVAEIKKQIKAGKTGPLLARRAAGNSSPSSDGASAVVLASP